MSIELTERTLGIWFVTIPNGDYLASVSRAEDGGAELIYRFRYYNSPDPWDEKDRKNWYRANVRDVEKCLETASRVSSELVAVSKGERWELLRGTGSFNDFVEEFHRLPFVHRRVEILPPEKLDPTP